MKLRLRQFPQRAADVIDFGVAQVFTHRQAQNGLTEAVRDRRCLAVVLHVGVAGLLGRNRRVVDADADPSLRQLSLNGIAIPADDDVVVPDRLQTEVEQSEDRSGLVGVADGLIVACGNSPSLLDDAIEVLDLQDRKPAWIGSRRLLKPMES